MVISVLRGSGGRAFRCVTQLLVLVSCAVLFALTPAMAQPGSEGAELSPDAPVTPVSQLYGPVPLARIVDGDTLVVESNIGPRTVRLIGIDTPEIGSGEPGGREAQAHLARLLGSGLLIWLELDLGLEDIYGRLLAYVYVRHNGAWEHAACAWSGEPGHDRGWLGAHTHHRTQRHLRHCTGPRPGRRNRRTRHLGGLLAQPAPSKTRRRPARLWSRTTQSTGADDNRRSDCTAACSPPPNAGEWVSVMLTAPTRAVSVRRGRAPSSASRRRAAQAVADQRLEQNVWNNSGASSPHERRRGGGHVGYAGLKRGPA